MEYKTLGSLVDRKIGYGIVQPGQNILDGVPVIKRMCSTSAAAKQSAE